MVEQCNGGRNSAGTADNRHCVVPRTIAVEAVEQRANGFALSLSSLVGSGLQR